MARVCNPDCYSWPYLVKPLEAENGTVEVAKSKILAAIHNLLGTGFDHRLVKYIVSD
jgi:hypothetical protein